MKAKAIFVGLFAVLVFVMQADAQQKKKTRVGKTLQAVGNKTAELAVKGTSKIVDKTYKDKLGPHGETVFIDNKSQYYYVSKTGKRVYIKVFNLRGRKGK